MPLISRQPKHPWSSPMQTSIKSWWFPMWLMNRHFWLSTGKLSQETFKSSLSVQPKISSFLSPFLTRQTSWTLWWDSSTIWSRPSQLSLRPSMVTFSTFLSSKEEPKFSILIWISNLVLKRSKVEGMLASWPSCIWIVFTGFRGMPSYLMEVMVSKL